MRFIDCFNGDADGICSLIQLRLASPVPPAAQILVTGVKRDQKLLEKAAVQPGDVVTVLDVSLDVNRDALVKALQANCPVLYVDHHFAGNVPKSELLETWIDEDAGTNTALLVNQRLGGKHWEWAVAGAFGDDMDKSAISLAKQHGMADADVAVCKKVGLYMNYNGYGPSIQDLHFPPDELYRLAAPFSTPSLFVKGLPDVWEKLERGYVDDMALANALTPVHETPNAAVYVLPDEKWARRVSGVYSNHLVDAFPKRAHAVLTQLPKKDQETFVVSIRSPLASRHDVNSAPAHALARQFDTGGGRAAAAGINVLPRQDVDKFVDAFIKYYSSNL